MCCRIRTDGARVPGHRDFFRKDPHVSMLRQDPLTGRWVIIATGRQGRPNEFPLLQRRGAGDGMCPFCPGHEAETTAEVVALGRPAGSPANGPGWRLRAFPNLYPAVTAAAAPAPLAAAPVPADLFPAAAGEGRHEVVVYSPDHRASLAALSVGDLAEVLGVVRDRVDSFRAEPGVRFVAPFCNHGPEAGATLTHPHLQIIGTPRPPLLTVEKAQRFNAWHRERGSCLLCDLVAAERRDGARLVAADAHWTAIAPWASRFPWEVLLVPTLHGPCPLEPDPAVRKSLAAMLGGVLRGLQAVHGDLSLNVVFHLAPQAAGAGGFGDPALDALGERAVSQWHGHIEILPRLSRLAGFEAGTGYAINAAMPEDAAARLRDVTVGPDFPAGTGEQA
jgi:UDPglucose--hexose-1-phosphate uridylyltransferase